jgi:hypothetical protein
MDESGTVVSEMVIDIYADPQSGEVTVFFDRPFRSTLKKLLFSEENRRLDFEYADGSIQYFGAEIKLELAPHLAGADRAAFVQVDNKEKQVTGGFFVPIEAV